MSSKKIIAVFLMLINCFNVFSLESFATEDSLTAREFANALQQFSADNSSNIYDSVFKEPLNRLIVKTNSNDPLDNTFGAVAVLEGYGGLHILQYDTEEETENAFYYLQQENVEYVEYDYWISLNTDRLKTCYCSENPDNPNDMCYCGGTTGYCTCLDNSSGNHLSWNSSAVMVDEALEYINTSETICEEVHVAVLDTGLDTENDFFDSTRILLDDGYCLEIDGKQYPSNTDGNFHGTHVSGILYDNTMNNVKIVPYRLMGKSLNNLDYSVLCGAINAAITKENESDDVDIDILNLSISMDPYDVESENILLNQTLKKAIDNNITVVVAAGNDSDDSINYIPSNYTNAIIVSATERNNTPDQSYSNFGDCVDIAAPGTDIYSTTPYVALKEDAYGNDVYASRLRFSGTSMATPLVAAAAATLKSIVPDITPAEIERIIKETAYVPDDWEESCDGKNYGTGIVNFYNMVKAVLEPEYSGTPTISINADNRFEITAPEGTDSRIYYTLDGSIPTLDSHLTYSGPLDLSNRNASSITAICHENGKLMGEPVNYRMVTYDEETVFYKWSDTLSANVDTENAKWKSYNPDIASVDGNGKIIGVSKGDTKITCTLPTGERIIYKVNVKYSPLQAFFVMFFFGFLWI